jgi:hypothetical protein
VPKPRAGSWPAAFLSGMRVRRMSAESGIGLVSSPAFRVLRDDPDCGVGCGGVERDAEFVERMRAWGAAVIWADG